MVYSIEYYHNDFLLGAHDDYYDVKFFNNKLFDSDACNSCRRSGKFF